MKNILDASFDDHLYHHIGLTKIELIKNIFDGFAAGMLFWLFTKSLNVFIFIEAIAAFLILFQATQEKNSYKIFQNRIVFFNQFFPEQFYTINFVKIKEVRFEDQLNKFLTYIYLDLKDKDLKFSGRGKKSIHKLSIRKRNKENQIITILDCFHGFNIPSFIQTKNEQINKAFN